MEMAARLAREGFQRVIGLGGDGTVHELVNGLVAADSPVNPETSLGILPVGTGSDLQRSLGIPRDLEKALEIIRAGRKAMLDVGKISYEAAHGQRQSRYFVNLASMGIGGEVAARAHNPAARLGGKAGFFWATVRTIVTFRGKPVRLWIDDDAQPRSFRVLNVAVGSGRYHGGGMYVCPRAWMDDGWLDVTVIEQLGLWILLRDIRYLYSGSIYDHPRCHFLPARCLRLEADEETRIEVDGEPLGRLPVEIHIVPRCLKVLVPAGCPAVKTVI